MKNIVYLVLFIITVVFLNSCQKKIGPDYNPDTVQAMENINYSPTFDWATSRVVVFIISSPTDTLINITSIDSKVRYNRGMFFAKDKVYKVKLCIPATVTQLKINDKSVDINANVINYTLI